MTAARDRARMRQQVAHILTNATATNTTFPSWGGGRGMYLIDASNWNGASTKMQFRPDGDATWWDVDNSTFTAKGGNTFILPPCDLRVVVSVAVPVAMNASLASAGDDT